MTGIFDGDGRFAPLIVGVTGKRNLAGREAETASTFARLFAELDRRLPHTPKLLLSSLAEGADTVAAEAALKRPDWSVLAPLPFEMAVYEDDFSGEALARLRGLAAHPKVMVRPLTALRRARGERRYTPSELMRAEGQHPYRTLHYEQAGLFIAERCALMIGVVDPARLSDKVGGADRILSHLRSRPDALAREVRERSAVLLDQAWLEQGMAPPVWTISLGEAEGGDLLVEVAGAEDAPAERLDNYNMLQSLGFARRLEVFNGYVRELADGAPPAADPEASGALTRLRSTLSAVQVRMKRLVHTTVNALVACFCLAVVALEAHIELQSYPWTEPLTVVYVLCAVLGVGIYTWARTERWQPLSEDYRAVAEALRVQRELWNAGLQDEDQRVDLNYLRGMHGSLSIVRRAVGQLIEGARLLFPMPKPDPLAPLRWAKDQMDFYHRRIRSRRLAVIMVHCSSWFLFVTGFSAAAFACLFIGQTPAWLSHWIHAEPELHAALTTLLRELVWVAAAFAVTLSLHIGAEGVKDRTFRLWTLRASAVPAVLAGVMIGAIGCDLAAVLPPPPAIEPHDLHHWREHQAEELILMAAVLAAAFAGAIRFMAEKLSWEAELQGYERTYEYFRNAHEELEGLAGDRSLAARARRRELVLGLAKEALNENEVWITAHRERPLEPVVGG